MSFQFDIHLFVIEFKPYLTVPLWVTKRQPKFALFVFNVWITLVCLKYYLKQIGDALLNASWTNRQFYNTIWSSSLRMLRLVNNGLISALKSENEIIQRALFCSLNIFWLKAFVIWPHIWQPYVKCDEKIAWYNVFRSSFVM